MTGQRHTASNKRNPRLGFMQGRLVEPVNGLIQAFPVSCWEDEFERASSIGLSLMEWTLDQVDLMKNPLMSTSGRRGIRELSQIHAIEVSSVTGDCFMQAPFWKAKTPAARSELERQFTEVVNASVALGIRVLVVPLVDNGALHTTLEEDIVTEVVSKSLSRSGTGGLRVAFESDYEPSELARFIGRFDPQIAGVNYDIGNSAALGFSAIDEIDCYGTRIINVHVKDRTLHGSTCPLGEGNADFVEVFRALRRVNYSANFILQTARAEDGDHERALDRYASFTEDHLSNV